jgi:hypothetical protein
MEHMFYGPFFYKITDISNMLLYQTKRHYDVNKNQILAPQC